MVSASVVAIVGTNASGKSDLALTLAAEFDAEILSADSRQVYRGFDLCSGKVTREQRSLVPHHGLDLVDVGTRFTLADYIAYARPVVGDIHGRGKHALVVGGTGLYVSALLDGFTLLSAPPDPALRRVREEAAAATLHAELRARDSFAADRIDPRNSRRLIRALEILDAGYTYADSRRRISPDYRTLRLGVTWPRDVLRNRIHDRLMRRLEAGMIKEVADALSAGVEESFLVDLGLEYRLIVRYLNGDLRSVDELIDTLNRAIYRFARRQLAWYRKDSRVLWLEVEGRESLAIAQMRTFLARS